MVVSYNSNGVLIGLLHIAWATGVEAGEDSGPTYILRIGVTVVINNLSKFIIKIASKSLLVLNNIVKAVLVNRAKYINNKLLK